jgi:hypothetical protein
MPTEALVTINNPRSSSRPAAALTISSVSRFRP